MSMALAEALIGQLADREPLRFRLRRKGSKIPRGAKVGDVEIGWTQHGRITGKGGEELGYYDRVLEWGGDAHDEHEMIVSVATQVTAPDGTPCSRIGAAEPARD